MPNISALQRMKLAQEGYGYSGSPEQEEQAASRRKKALAAAAAMLAAGGYAGSRIGKYFGQQGVLKHLSDDANLAHFATRGGERSFKAWPGYAIDVTKKIKYKG